MSAETVRSSVRALEGSKPGSKHARVETPSSLPLSSPNALLTLLGGPLPLWNSHSLSWPAGDFGDPYCPRPPKGCVCGGGPGSNSKACLRGDVCGVGGTQAEKSDSNSSGVLSISKQIRQGNEASTCNCAVWFCGRTGVVKGRGVLRGLPGRAELDPSPQGWTEVPVGRRGQDEPRVRTETLPSPSTCIRVLSASWILSVFCRLTRCLCSLRKGAKSLLPEDLCPRP